MKLNIIDAESIYRRLLVTSSVEERESIYRKELLAPFEGMMRIFGGGDPLALARIWTLYAPDDFVGEARPVVEALVERMAADKAWRRCAAALERGIAAFGPYADGIPLDSITGALVLLDARRANPLDRGYTGFGGIPGYVMVAFSQANDYTLPRVEGASVHELNHNVRFKIVPFNPLRITVADYIIAEGLAEAFAAELYGDEVLGYYVTDFSEEELATAKQIIGDALEVSGFDAVRGYIFGDAISEFMGRSKMGVPNFAGYAVGYRIVRQYLQRTGKSVAEGTFLPSSEIIAESGFF